MKAYARPPPLSTATLPSGLLRTLLYRPYLSDTVLLGQGTTGKWRETPNSYQGPSKNVCAKGETSGQAVGGASVITKSATEPSNRHAMPSSSATIRGRSTAQVS